jgi:hypothetical protein
MRHAAEATTTKMKYLNTNEIFKYNIFMWIYHTLSTGLAQPSMKINVFLIFTGELLCQEGRWSFLDTFEGSMKVY